MTTITITNPWSGALVERDITGLSQEALDGYVAVMDDDVCEQVARDLAPCLPEEFLAEYCRRVGPHAAGIVVLGS